MNLQKAFIQQLRTSFPGLQSEPLDNLVSENLLSPFTVELSASIGTQAQEIIQSIFYMRELPEYCEHYASLIKAKGLSDPGNKSIMMSYDFHIDENQQLKLIEVNTNASFLVLGHEMYKMRQAPLPVADFTLNEVRKDIETELRLQGKSLPTKIKLAIVDDKPQEQRLFIEFLAYNELFKSWGWDSRILDYNDLFKNFDPDFIYNRYTDFFLTDASSALLREKFLRREVCVSPQPFEYLMLADKQRLIDWREPGFLDRLPLTERQKEVITHATPLSYDMCAEKADEIWSNRKKFFFKPKNAFGSKLSYRGSSISRKAFEEILPQDMIAQEFIPAPEQTFETPEGPQKFKYDLRCYAYQGRMQLIVARLYQGQVTNLRTPYGGFAPVSFKN
ncbi:hypothetical protein D3C87_90190 [compost metagenome]